jgi:hypothetical protein
VNRWPCHAHAYARENTKARLERCLRCRAVRRRLLVTDPASTLRRDAARTKPSSGRSGSGRSSTRPRGSSALTLTTRPAAGSPRTTRSSKTGPSRRCPRCRTPTAERRRSQRRQQSRCTLRLLPPPAYTSSTIHQALPLSESHPWRGCSVVAVGHPGSATHFHLLPVLLRLLRPTSPGCRASRPPRA